MSPRIAAKWSTVVAIVLMIVALNVDSGFTQDFLENHPEAKVVFNTTISTADRKIQLIYTHTSESVSFRWNSNLNKSIDYCRWDRAIPFDHNPLSIVSTTPNSADGYLMNIAGLQNGFCELTISNVQDMDLTLWNCTVIDKEMRHDGPAVSMGTVNLTAFVKPSSPKLNELENLIDKNGTAGNSTVNITCCANGGRPSPKLAIALNNHVLDETPNYDHPNNSQPTGDEFCLNIENVHLNWSHNGNKLICTAHHPAYTESDARQDGFALNIYHEPKILTPFTSDNEIKFTTDKSENIERVYIQFVGNPFPDVHWMMKTSNGEFERLPYDIEHRLIENLESKSWEAEITNPIVAANYNAAFLFIVKNKYGYREVQVKIELSSGAGWGWIVIFTVGGIAAVIITVLLILKLMKRQGWCCYKEERDFKRNRNGVYGSPEEIDESNLPDEYELNPTLVRTKEPVRTREGTVYVAPSTSM